MTSEKITADDIFDCQKCGHCCRGYGGTYVTDLDLKNISAFTGISIDELLNRYCRVSGRKRVLAQKPDGYCVFWDELCTIHPVKPKMCRAWPFITNVLRSPENWEVMATACPGIRTGFPESDIIACVEEQLAIRADAGDKR